MSIDYKDVCATQAKEIFELKALLNEYREFQRTVYGTLYNCGAPLNDNALEFNERQLKYLHNRLADAFVDDRECWPDD